MSHVHGGPDVHGVPRWDFSTNANACGPCPSALTAVQRADAARYPDPAYAVLRAALAEFHGVAAERIVVAGSASEFIARITAAMASEGRQRVWLPALAYGDYAHAARAWGLQRVDEPAQADLAWLCEPSSPRGVAEATAPVVADACAVVVLDRAYEPLRLSGSCSLDPAALDRVWQLWSPNKALGLTGVRGAYAIAPPRGLALARRLEQLAPSWPLGAHAVAMLLAWVLPEAQHWLAQSRALLARWKAGQQALLQDAGWWCLPSETNYFCARAPYAVDAVALRAQGIKLRDTASMGLADHWRLGVLSPEGQAALAKALGHQVRGPEAVGPAKKGSHVQDAQRRRGAIES